ncbi:hypothetical protein PM03_04925 [Thalassobacter stenotrophicus]|uniref:AbiU2 domain-containing protein n=1 Tax=Thalassobacter TaxID=266808 RepID=UPI00051D5F4A|nr:MULTISPECIES: hypothetical protein [Thalassobacter]KGK80028.1 hypothetical protein PM03_04925 [Thalassobacter stenotrophicus]KGL03116.1 hypothetical protein PM04_00320 [Thalassobacter sp. 16PALIMAR09]
MTFHTPEEKLKNLKAKLGPEFGTAIYWLDNALTNAFIELQIFHGFFVTSPKRVEVLNEASGLVATYAGKTLWDSLCMSICRLTDPKKSVGQPNLCLETLCDYLKEAEHPEFRTLLNDAMQTAKPFRARRNKVLAHADIDIATKISTIKGNSYNDTKNCLDKCAVCVNYVYGEFFATTMLYDDCITATKDERAFLKSLYLGNKLIADNSAATKAAVVKKDWTEVERLETEVEVPGWIERE